MEYENEDDMRIAYKRGDGRKIDGRRVMVDVERGRTVRNWLVRGVGWGCFSFGRSGADSIQVFFWGRRVRSPPKLCPCRRCCSCSWWRW